MAIYYDANGNAVGEVPLGFTSVLNSDRGYTTQRSPTVKTGISPTNISSLSKVGSIFDTSTVPGGFNGINTWGANNLGTALPGVEGTGLLGGTSLTGIGAGAGIGGLVGMFNPLAKGSTAGSIAGTVGGAIGSAFGPIGSLAGGFIGSSLGGLLGGKKKPHPGSSFEAILDNDYNYQSPVSKSKHMGNESTDAVSKEMLPYLKNLQANGIKLPDAVNVGTYFNDSGTGTLFYRDKAEVDKGSITNKIEFDPNDPVARDKAYKELATQLAKRGGASEEVLAKINQFTSAELTPASQGGGGLMTPRIEVKNLAKDKSWDSFMATYKQGNA